VERKREEKPLCGAGGGGVSNRVSPKKVVFVC
jgi:hypothetical protein